MMSRFEPWRRFMLTGALILLAYYVGVALFKDQGPQWLSMAVNAVGYGFLAVGFVTRMRERTAEREAQARDADDELPAPDSASEGPAPDSASEDEAPR